MLVVLTHSLDKFRSDSTTVYATVMCDSGEEHVDETLYGMADVSTNNSNESQQMELASTSDTRVGITAWLLATPDV